MIFVDKQRIVPAAFLEATEGLTDYDQLGQDVDRRKAVIDLLLAEQGGLCPLCERDKFGPTLEHYLPRSANPELQLDYYNLYVCCQPCNGPKATFLIPPYIFDRRFDPCQAQSPISQNDGVYQQFEAAADDHCYLKVPAASVFSSLSEPHSAHVAGRMLHYTIVLTNQNRQGPDHANLVKARGAVLKSIRLAFSKLTPLQILQKWNEIIQARSRVGYRFPAFVSLHIQELARARKARGV